MTTRASRVAQMRKGKSLCPQLGGGLPLQVVAVRAGGYALPIGHEHRSADEFAALKRVQSRLELL